MTTYGIGEWKTRIGARVEITEIEKGDITLPWPLRGYIEDHHSGVLWKLDGSFSTDGKPHDFDLIGPWEEMPRPGSITIVPEGDKPFTPILANSAAPELGDDTPSDGGPAFPVHTIDGALAWGMSLRDYFAAAALQGLLATPAPVKENGKPIEGPNGYAVGAYRFADAMLRARSGGGK